MIIIELNDVMVAIGTIAAILSAYFAYKQNKNLINEKNNQRILKKQFGSELFGIEVINRSTYCYVEPNCTDLDPMREAEPRNLCMVKGDMFSVLDDYLMKELTNEAIHHILILADSGMGKTSLLLNYYAYNQNKSNNKRLKIVLIPLGISNADGYIEKINNKEDIILFLDAFDEDTKAIKSHRDRLSILMNKCSQFKRVVITCRTQFFTSDEEIPKETGIIKVKPRKAGEQGIYYFNKLYLSPLNDFQVNKFLNKRFKWNRSRRKKAIELVKQIPNLKVRPMLLANIPNLIDNFKINRTMYTFQLYEILIDNWLEREKGWISNKEDLRNFSEKLAYDIYLNREERGAEKINVTDLSFLAKEWNINLDKWQLTSRSLLNRDAEGNYKFAHRSIMEFLFYMLFL